MTFEQWPIKLKIDDIVQFMPYLIMAIPSEHKKCKAQELSIECHLDKSRLSREAYSWGGINKMLGKNIDATHVYPIQEMVADVKNRAIISDIIKLAGKIQIKYLNQLMDFGINIEDASRKTKQIIEIPFSLLDLYPGDTQVHYKIFTKRELCVL